MTLAPALRNSLCSCRTVWNIQVCHITGKTAKTATREEALISNVYLLSGFHVVCSLSYQPQDEWQQPQESMVQPSHTPSSPEQTRNLHRLSPPPQHSDVQGYPVWVEGSMFKHYVSRKATRMKDKRGQNVCDLKIQRNKRAQMSQHILQFDDDRDTNV